MLIYFIQKRIYIIKYLLFIFINFVYENIKHRLCNILKYDIQSLAYLDWLQIIMQFQDIEIALAVYELVLLPPL